MRKFMSVMVLAAVLGAGSACGGSTGDTAASATSAAAAPTPSASPSPAGNTKSICDAAKTMLAQTNVDGFTKEFGALVQARKLKNAQAEAVAKKAIQDEVNTWLPTLKKLAQDADDASLRTALGNLATALTTASSDATLAGVNSIEDAARVAGPVSDAVADVTKACG
jgi:hypothetical protein